MQRGKSFTKRKSFTITAPDDGLPAPGRPLRTNASVVHPLTTCGYNAYNLQDNSTAIEVEVAPQCAGEAADSPSIWEYVPISDGNQDICYSVTSRSLPDGFPAGGAEKLPAGGERYGFAIQRLRGTWRRGRPGLARGP